MLEPDLFHIFVKRLNCLGIRYMITGSVASTIYGEPRLTHDIDFVIEIQKDQIEGLIKAFSARDSSGIRVLSPRILPPAIGELGSTARTATFFP